MEEITYWVKDVRIHSTPMDEEFDKSEAKK